MKLPIQKRLVQPIMMSLGMSALAICIYSILGGEVDLFKILLISFIVSVSYLLTPIDIRQGNLKQKVEKKNETQDQ